MPNAQKIAVVEELTKKFQEANGIYFTRYTGLSVSHVTELRKQFRENSVSYFISKNTLTKLAAQNAGYENRLDDIFQGQIGIAYASNDPTAPARVIKDFKKGHKELLEVVGVVFEGEIFSPEKYKQLANLPSREVLIGKFLGAINQPMTKLASTLNGAMSKLAGTLESLKNTKS